MLTLGLRRGEAVALRWDEDVDLDAETLEVADAKTPSGKRMIPLVAGVADALREHRRRQIAERLTAGPHWTDTGHVFTYEDGRPITGKAALLWWHWLTIAAGVASTPVATPPRP